MGVISPLSIDNDYGQHIYDIVPQQFHAGGLYWRMRDG